jgi:cation:H+ antiporter
LARRLGLSELLIGLTPVGFGTSAPELMTSIDAALQGWPGIALGNVLGSNIGNILLILAIVVLIRPLAVNPAAIGRDGALFVMSLVSYVLAIWRIEQSGGAAARAAPRPAPRS